MGGVDTDVRKAFKDAFDKFDTDKDGHITETELGVVLKGLNIHATRAEILDLITQVDTDKSGTIEFEEFLEIMQQKMASMDPAEMVTIAFGAFDHDGDRKIGKGDLAKVMAELGEVVTQEEVEELIRVADTDNDGKLDQNEFIEWMRQR